MISEKIFNRVADCDYYFFGSSYFYKYCTYPKWESVGTFFSWFFVRDIPYTHMVEFFLWEEVEWLIV
jgi:hypothetical protein